MIRNYFKTGLRKLRKEFGYTLANVLGLSLGLTCSILILLFIQDEISYDNFISNGDRILRVDVGWKTTKGEEWSPMATTAAGPFLKERFSNIEEFVRFRADPYVAILKDDEAIKESGFYFVDSTFFKVFKLKLLKGNTKKALTKPQSIVLTESMALKYFGQDWMKRKIVGADFIIHSFNNRTYQVTGIVQDMPANSHLQFNFLASFNSLLDSKRTSWYTNIDPTYILLSPGSSAEKLLSQMPLKLEETNVQGYQAILDLEPLKDIYLHSKYGNSLGPIGSYMNLWVFGLIGVVIFLISSINFVNLATVRANSRTKEVGVRRIIGASKNQLIGQNLTETIILVLISVIISLIFIYLFLSSFNELTGKHFIPHILFNLSSLVSITLMIFTVILTSGLYPAIFVSKIRIDKITKGKYTHSLKGKIFRQGIILVQFSISLLLVASAIIIYSQLDYMRNKNLGLNNHNVLMVPTYSTGKIETLLNEFKRNPGITALGTSLYPVNDIEFTTHFYEVGNEEATKNNFRTTQVGAGFLPSLSIGLEAGRNFSNKYQENTLYEFILNNKALEFFGWKPTDAIGRKLKMNWGVRGEREGTIIGVVHDFNYQSLKSEIEPLILFSNSKPVPGYLIAKISGANLKETISFMSSTWKEIVPLNPFNFQFLDENFNSQYKAEIRLSRLISVFCVVAILLSCLGLLSLASYVLLQKFKEISIRKIFGAQTGAIVLKLLISFSRPVLISSIFIIPLTYFLMDRWLQSFAYKVKINPLIFFLALAGIFLIIVITVGYQTIKAAYANPSEILKNEE